MNELWARYTISTRGTSTRLPGQTVMPRDFQAPEGKLFFSKKIFSKQIFLV